VEINLLFKQEAYEIIGICMEVYNNLGYGFSEVVYKDAIEIEFIEHNKNFCREKEYPVIYKKRSLKRTFNTDFTIADKIVIEVKAYTDGIQEDAVAQTINYLKASGVRHPAWPDYKFWQAKVRLQTGGFLI
jgi:GxxExxY protein